MHVEMRIIIRNLWMSLKSSENSMKTRLGQMIYNDGEEHGREEMQKKMNSLINALLTANRVDDCLKATEDKEYQKQLMKEFGIK